MANDERDTSPDPEVRTAPDTVLAVENADLPQSETVSEFGDVGAKEQAISVERGRIEESGGVAEQQAYLAREARISDADREQQAKDADIRNEVRGRDSKPPLN